MSERTEKTKKRIGRAAAEVFAMKGLHYATIEEIARKANVSAGSIYQHFTNKENLLFSIALPFWKALNQNLAKKMEGNPHNHIFCVLDAIGEEIIDKKEGPCLAVASDEVRLFGSNRPKFKKVRKKLEDIEGEIQKLLKTIDHILLEEQRCGIVRRDINHIMLRNIFYGGVRRLIYELYKSSQRTDKQGGSKEDVKEAMRRFIGSFMTSGAS